MKLNELYAKPIKEVKNFVKIADKSGEWKACRGGVYFQKNDGRNGE